MNVTQVPEASTSPEETLDYPVPLKCNNDVVHIREELSFLV